MASIVVGSVNCRGLANKVKRLDIFSICKKRYDIAVLVDTHCCLENENKWLQEWGYTGKFSSYSNRSRGVAVLFKNSFEFKINNEIIDNNSNFIVLDITVQDYRLTLVALYGPNEDCPEFFHSLESKICLFENSSVIVVGDWNVVQNYSLDTLNYQTENNPRAQVKIHEMMNNLDLLDIWRIQNPSVKRYSWRGPNKKQGRLDYFCISSDLEPFVVTSDIGISYRSDHSPVRIDLKFINQIRGKGTWKFNNSLLKDIDFIKKVKHDITEVISEYECDPNEDLENLDKAYKIDNQLLWETIKMKIRGTAISCSSFKKKEKDKMENMLFGKLEKLNDLFALNNSDEIRLDIEKVETELKILREDKINGIIIRAKAKWQVEGEKNTRFFCNLEKKHYTEKIISKLLLEGNQVIQDPNAILREQKLFYETLYRSSNPGDEENATFMNENNPFLNKPSREEINSCEGQITLKECSIALKNMKNLKSPGIDGFTVEFYKFFWNDIKFPLVNCLNESLEKGKFSVSQRQGLIVCLPKEGKEKHFIKNWRPITLLCVDYKLASACIAKRLKPILQNIISQTQKGFLKGRYIGECVRIIADLIDKLEEEDIPGLLLLVDFEKAFDTVEWSFIEKTLDFYGFGPTLCRWIKCFYTDITSTVTNNGHLSEFFNLARGVRQGDPLSPYLFILVLELLSAALKYDPIVSGVTVNDSEFLLSQYADDSSLILDENEESLKQALHIFDSFAACAGLRVNVDKTEAIWVGSRLGSNEKLLPNRKLSWNTSGKFKLLGIRFNLLNEDKTLENYTEKIKSMKSLLNLWSYRNLTYIGKTIVIKTLALPLLVQVLTVLPNPPVQVIQEIQGIFIKFLWDGKPDKIKRKVIINNYDEGGLKFPHIESFCMSLKMSWLYKLLDPLNISPWKILLLSYIEKYGGDKILYLTKEGLEKIAKKLNPFWRDIFLNLAKLKPEKVKDENNPINILSQPIWLNINIKRCGKPFIFENYCNDGIFFINDLISDGKNILTFEQLKTQYAVKTNFVEYYGLVSAIPDIWKKTISDHGRLDIIENDIVEKLKNDKKPCKYFYQLFLEKIKENPLRSQNKWSDALCVKIDDWGKIYSMAFQATKNTKLQNFQFKLLHRIVYTNSFLYKCGLIETELCTFCTETKESLLHIFGNVYIAKIFG